MSLVFTKNYTRGLNITLIYLSLFIISVLVNAFLFIGIKNHISNGLIRLALILAIIVNVAVIGFVLLFIDTFIIFSFFAVLIVLGEFAASVIYLIHSFKM